MAVVDRVALAAAEKVEATAGPRAGLAAWKTLVLNVASMETRGRAILGALRCAATLKDDAAATLAIGWWPSIRQAGYFDDVVQRCAAMQRAGMRQAACDFAKAEAERWPTARAEYLAGRCLEGHAESEAAAHFERAASRAEKEGLARLARASRARRVALLARSRETRPSALGEASEIDLEALDGEDRLRVCRVLLGAPNRFVRARALAALTNVAKSDPRGATSPLALSAIRLAARHADDAGTDLSPLETERIAVALAAWPSESEREEALRRLAGASEAPPDTLTERGRDTIDALRSTRWSDATRALDDARAHASEARVPPVLWTAAQRALLHDDAEVQRAALALVETLLARFAVAPPPRGYVALAAVLSRVLRGRVDPVRTALRAAHARGEPEGASALMRALCNEGWAEAERARHARAVGDLDEARRRRRFARALLSEAKGLST